MIITKKVTVENDEIVGIVCDKCKKEFSDLLELQEFHHIRFTGGYGSAFGDGMNVECDICQSCLHEMIKDICRTKFNE